MAEMIAWMGKGVTKVHKGRQFATFNNKIEMLTSGRSTSRMKVTRSMNFNFLRLEVVAAAVV